MAQRKTLTKKQLDVLRWVADGRPDGVFEGDHHRISAAALRRRGLLTTSGRGPSWSAEITEAGRQYIANADGPNPPIPRQANTSVTAQLVADVIAAGGSVRVPRRYYGRTGVDYEQRARLAERYGKVPEGKRLVVEPVSSEELQIDLVDVPEGTPYGPEPVPVPRRVSRYHPVVKQFKERSERHEVSRVALPRVLRILQGLIVEAEGREYEVSLAQPTGDSRSRRSVWSGGRHGHIVIAVRGHVTALRVSEEGLQSRTYWEDRNRTWSHARGEYRSAPLSEYEANATGRIAIVAVSSYGGRGSTWADRRSGTLEEKLPLLLSDLEYEATEHERRQQNAKRQAIERKRQWQIAMDRARERHAERHRTELLRDQARRWQEAEQIRAYCDAAETAYPDDPQTIAWLAWARRHADQLDPLRTAPRIPDAPDPESVSGEELRPLLEGWSPHGPDRW